MIRDPLPPLVDDHGFALADPLVEWVRDRIGPAIDYAAPRLALFLAIWMALRLARAFWSGSL